MSVFDDFEDSADGRTIAEDPGEPSEPVGRPDLDSRNGLYKLEIQLNFGDEDRLERLFGSSGH